MTHHEGAGRVKPLAVSYRDAAKMLGICDRKLWQLVKDGELRAVRMGRSVRIPARELERFVHELAAFNPADDDASQANLAA